MTTSEKENFTIFVCLFCCFTPKSTDIAMSGYYLHFMQILSNIGMPRHPKYNLLIKQLMLIDIDALKRSQFYF